MWSTRRRAMRFLCLVGVFLPGLIFAQPYPVKPIRLVAAFPAGTGVDVAARIVAHKIGESLGQQVLVDNRAGAGGNIAAELVAKAPRDGYTLLFTNNAHTINPNLYRKLPYHAITDFVPISLAGSSAMILVGHPSLPARTVKDLIALAKARPGVINIASAGAGSPSHLGGALFKSMADIEIVHVPYKGAPPALTDLIAGQVDLYMSGLPPALPMVRAGRVRGFAVTTTKRSFAAPDIPTFAESGLPQYDVTLWYGLFSPAGVSPSIIEKLNAEVVKALRTPDGQERFRAQGLDPTTNSPAEFSALIKAELSQWAKVVKDARMQVE